MTANISIIELGIELFTTQVKDSFYHIAKIMSESFFGLVNSMQILDRTLKDNANMILRALGSEEHWATKDEILTGELIESLNAFKGYTGEWVDFIHDPEWGKDFWESVQEDAQKTFDQIYNWSTTAIGKTFEQQIGFIADTSQEFGQLKIKFFEDLKDVGEQMDEHLEKYITTLFNEFELWKSGLEEEGGESGEGVGGSNFQKGMDSLKKMGKNFGKRMVLKGVQAVMSLITQIINISASPVTSAFSKTLESLGKILNMVLKPLEPFFFLLELIATVIGAALAPLEIHLWEAFADVFKELVDMIPELQEMVEGWIESDEDLKETIQGIINGVLGLIDAFVSGELLKKFYDLSVSLLGLVGQIASPGFLESLLDLAVAFGELALELVKLMPTLTFIIDLITGLVDALNKVIIGQPRGGAEPGTPQPNFFEVLVTWWTALWSGTTSAQEGGEIPRTGPIFAHQGETIHKKGIDDEILAALGEIAYLQKRILRMKEEKYR